MREVTILSPHRDDAAFSLFSVLTAWSALGTKIKVLNFFTVSGYGPHAGTGQVASVSGIRSQEDRRALRKISGLITIVDLDLLDAPIRYGIDSATVCQERTRSLLSKDQVDRLATAISVERSGLAIAPLGLGDHIDHLAIREASILAVSPDKLGFYEDFPYATWTSGEALGRRVSETESALRSRLRPAVVRVPGAAWRKRQVIAQYRSQITPEEAAAMARWSSSRGGSERIWIPRHSRRWSFPH